MNKNTLFLLNKRGIVPGPEESEEDYFFRAEHLLQNSHRTIPQSVLSKLQKKYDIAPDWVQVTHERNGLLPWQGGCTTIDYSDTGSATGVCVQIPPLRWPLNRWYACDEILLHELVHVGRLAFDEQVFEEIFSYQMSPVIWRSEIGPLCHQLARYPLLLATGAIIGATLAPLTTLIGGSIGLTLLRKKNQNMIAALKRCKSLFAELTSTTIARYITYRLTDEEILLFSQTAPSQLNHVLNKYLDSELRWQVIRMVYLDSISNS